MHKNRIFLVYRIYYYQAVYSYLLKPNSLRNVNKTSKLYKRNKQGMDDLLVIWGNGGEKVKNP